MLAVPPLGAALCAPIGGRAAQRTIGAVSFAWRPLSQDPAALQSWRPAELTDGRLVAFHGYFDNAAQISAELGIDASDPARLYGEAVAAWGDEADCRIIGEYCAVMADPRQRCLRLSRSPLQAPPLVYHNDRTSAAAGSIPAPLFAAGVERVLDEAVTADRASFNFSDPEATWFREIRRVPLGSVVELRPDGERQLHRYYDLAKLPRQRLGSARAYVDKTRELLAEAVEVAMRGFSQPGAALSSGLDSPQIAYHALRQLPAGQPLPTFTFQPEPGWDGITDQGANGNERPMVEAFCAMHPGIEPHFTDNRGYGHDHRWHDFLRIMDGAPAGLGTMYVLHGLFSGARTRGCDVLLFATWGNLTFSEQGIWGFSEYFLKGRWHQLWMALKNHGHPPHPMWRRFVSTSLVPLLPDWLWRRLRRLWRSDVTVLQEAVNPLRASYREFSRADARLARTDPPLDRHHPRSRAHALELEFGKGDFDLAEIYQAFQLLYGLPCRDPTAYRPFAEFCFGLPTDVFLRDGQIRWLAKQLGEGIMPEAQRANLRNGRWDADGQLRVRRRRADFLEELDRIEADDELNAMIDVPRLRAALLALPEHTSTDRHEYYPVVVAMMRGLLTARFVNYIKGRN